jgi:hypothetical protein
MVLVAALALGGCATAQLRNAVSSAAAAEKAVIPGMPTVRFWGDESPKDIVAETKRLFPNLSRLAQSASKVDGRPLVEYLALSGGGSDGAFGAGLLAGWTARGNRPTFEVVTGVSAGAIIAPFAFLGSQYDRTLQEIWTQYEINEIAVAQILPGILGGQSLADTAPLANLIAKFVDRRLLNAIAREYRKGRVLLIGTTNLDAQRPVIWNMGEIAASRHPEALDLFRKVVLASAAIPGVFPPVNIAVESEGEIKEEMHVDGGVTREVFVTPARINLKEFDRLYPVPPVRRLYIVKNGKLDPEFEVVQPTTVSIAIRSIYTLTKSQNRGDIYRIYRLARDSGADFNLAAVPASFDAQPKQAFDPVYQRRLYAEGFHIGREGGPWLKILPEQPATSGSR